MLGKKKTVKPKNLNNAKKKKKKKKNQYHEFQLKTN
jgi:hypothetical protein